MSLQQLLYGCITSSVPAKKLVALVTRYGEREKAAHPELDLRTAVAQCLLDTFQKLASARPIIASYLRECISSDLLSVHQVARYVIARGRTGTDGTSAEDHQDLSGDDLERIAEIIMTDLPASMVTDAPSTGTTDEKKTASLTSLLASLTDLLDDITDERPALCHLFVSLLATVPSIDSLSESDAEAVTKMETKAAAVASIHKTALQEIQLLVTPADRAGDPPFNDDGGLSGNNALPSLPPSPEPWTATTSGQTTDGTATSITKIRAPPYITFLVQNAMDASWVSTSRHGASSPEVSADIPDVYRRIVHTAPEVSSRPVTFFYHLLCASFGLLASSIDDLQARAAREEQQSTSMMDSADEVMLNLNGGQSGELSDSLKHARMKEIIARDGWRTWIWCFGGFVEVLEYWKTLSHDSENGVFAHRWQLPHAEKLSEVLEHFGIAHSSELERCYQVLSQLRQSGNTGSTASASSLVQLFTETITTAGVLTGVDNASSKADGNANLPPNADVDAYSLSNSEPSQFSSQFFEALMLPAPWRALVHHLTEQLEDTASVSDNFLTIMTNCKGLLDLICHYRRPNALLKVVYKAVQELDERSRTSNDDPQTTFSTFGAWYLLAHAICHKYRLPKPEMLRTCTNILNIRELAQEDEQTLRGWIEALFGSSGIGDDLLQMTSPIKLLSMSTTVVSQAILAATAQVIDLETLRGGLSYFSQPLLSWCQIGILLWLCQEIQRQGMYAHVYLDVLQALLEAGDFPPAILQVTANEILNLFEQGNGLELVLESSNIDTLSIQRKARFSKHSGEGDDSAFITQTVPLTCSSALQSILRSPRIYDEDVESAALLCVLVKRVQRINNLQGIDFASALAQSKTGQRLLVVIFSSIAVVDRQIYGSLRDACQRIDRYSM